MGKIKRRARKTHQPVTPRMIPPVEHWSGDLPDTAAEQFYPPQLIRVNEINDIWMEIPRYVNHGWWGVWLVCIVILLSACYFVTSPYALLDMFSGISGFIFYLISFILLGSLNVFFLKIVLFEPRGAPLRFNRKRQKVYAYEYQRGIWPWKRWPVQVKVFDWADIHAERVQMSGHAEWGHRIYCAVCKPGTCDVVDRFVLTWTVGDVSAVYGLWSHCCHYMEAKPVPKNPLWTDTPRDWTPFTTVRWPEDIDKQSSTAPY
ncbi:hypothetical protein HV096_02625 [Citrobacter freundii]|uniref:DUF6708 domain-containing protein n=1 Tax=Citrobacter sp. wls711 TaxID=2576425 RepID=UPI000BBD273A|nr:MULTISPECIES: DUF6708 domain-containing protein [Citrobacter]ATF47749.1 hypothetical protein CO701_00560 [Citrobacter werkmanii]HEE0107428.1 hypothetical protein [Citrobacter gillenii]EJB8471980.1 hypothetical protein [Citrobacter freundii]EJB8558786.1 hypothetical protein [Citrobacter freundii]MBA8031052.1 hypothetical protein [Citrobacter freundii]